MDRFQPKNLHNWNFTSTFAMVMEAESNIRHQLTDELKQENCFWSYDNESIKDVPDDILIEKTLRHLDLPEIDLLFKIFSFRKIKQVWLERLVPQEEYLYTLNRFLAWYYFKIKRPDAYIKSMATRHFNRLYS